MNRPIKVIFNTILLAVIVFLSACNDPSTNNTNDAYTAEYRLLIKTDAPLALDNAQIKVKLYGTARYVADNEATLIAEYTSRIQQLPTTINLNWPTAAYQMIDSPPVNQASEAVYYFIISVDRDGDGQICDADLIQDYDKTPFLTVDGMPTSTTEVFLTASHNDTCHPV